ncbi:hypothetical protein NXF25_019560 [Crotalus adamanteus]|uniref:Protein FAM171A1 n=1 Tax=Crotalus adamanteus TaxID=8729 RepID=A0AAW1B233_CROAD
MLIKIEVTLKVHVSDASTHQPVTEAFIEIFTNQVPIASGNTGADGTAFIKFQYKLDSQLIVTATKQAYVPNSAPWKPVRLPVFSSLSLGLLPERSATLMVYEDVVQIVSGFQGARIQPKVHFQRRALRLPENTSYSDLTAFLTSASSPWEVDSFPYLQGYDGNGTGNNTRYDLTPVTAVSVHLLRSDGTPVPVNGPIYVTVPLPATNNLKHHTHVPAWRFDQKLGTWLKSNLGTIEQEGNGLTWTYIASQLGYWVAAMSPTNPGLIVAKDFTTYHTVFLLAILGGIALILLVLLCLLLYYCRRKCLKPRQHHKKLRLSSTLSGAKKDQSTSMSHLNLVFSRRESEFPASLNDASLAQMNSEVQLLTEKALMELGGGKPLPHPRAWFVSLDGRSNAHVRHSYIDLQRAGRNGSNDVSLDSGVDMNEPKSARKGRADHLQQTHQQAQVHPQKEQKIPESSTYTQLVYLDEVDQSGSECGTAVCSPEDNTPRCVLEGGSRRTGGQLPSLEEETIKRTVESSPEPLTSPEHKMTEHSEADDDDDNDDDDQGEDKKSPWQKREERPLMAFNLK